MCFFSMFFDKEREQIYKLSALFLIKSYIILNTV